VPLYTTILASSGGDYGIVTNIYSYTALLLVILTFGMETTFLRFANKQEENPELVYGNSLIMVGSVALIFIIAVLCNLSPLSSFMGYSDHPDYVGMMFTCAAIDAFQAIPFVYLRYKKRPWKFMAFKMIFIFATIFFNVLYLVVLPHLYKSNPDLIGRIYDPTVGVGYIFRINLSCTALMTLCFYKELTGFRYKLDFKLVKRMLTYSWPLLILGIAGILNQTASNILYPFLVPGKEGRVQLGLFGAATKIAMIMALITQAFRYAYEPFVFGKSRDKDNRDVYAKTMKFFIIFTLLAFLFVVAYLDILRFFIGHTYWSALRIVPIVMAAEIMFGVYFNLSFWYKLIDKTIWGAYFSGISCVVLIAINIIFVPRYGYIACAWAGFAGYGTCMLLSYFVGQKYYPINYPLADIFKYVLLTVVLFIGMYFVQKYLSTFPAVGVNTILIILFIVYFVKKDVPLSSLPRIGRFFHKG
jgi:O-antigen/teichoic acid export membrane protein